jgi:hypothetical protein
MSAYVAPITRLLGGGLGQPASRLFLVTPSDTAVLSFATRAIRVGGAGDLAVRTVEGDVVTIPSVLAGEVVSVEADKVYATNTTATLILGMA